MDTSTVPPGNPAGRAWIQYNCSNTQINMKSIITLALAVAALTLAACASKKTNQAPPPPVDMGHRSGK
jgi:hypothetical protein